MAHFAKLNENNIVLEVLVVKNEVILDENNNENEQKGIDFLKNVTGHEKWKQTSYNHNFRNCYAGLGYLYDDQNDRFIEPKPFNSWILVNELVKSKRADIANALDTVKWDVQKENEEAKVFFYKRLKDLLAK